MKDTCKNCGKPDVHFEGKYCSILCADMHEKVFDKSELEQMSNTTKQLMGYKITDTIDDKELV